MRDALILIVSSPSGGGKTTIVNSVLESMPGVKRSISCTTRKMRLGEKDKVDYVFLSEEEFKKKIEANEFLEWEQNFGAYYGTSVETVKEITNEGNDVILSIDVKGAKRVKKKFPESVSVFIMPPSIDELKTRLKKRNTEKEAELSVRVNESEREMAAADEYDYLIVNKDLDKAVEELKNIIETERKNREQKKKM